MYVSEHTHHISLLFQIKAEYSEYNMLNLRGRYKTF